MSDDPLLADLERFAELVRGADSALFITGAGVSADSGLPTYRGVGGLYEQAATDEGVPIEVALSGAMFEADPGLTWKYIHQVESALRGARHNVAHAIIAALQSQIERLVVLTQNVDGLHRQAGSRDVVEIHGNLHRLDCTACAWSETVGDYGQLDIPPACPRCGSLVRPRVVLFGEYLPADAVQRLQTELRRGFDLVVSVGTSSSFPYIASPIVMAARSGTPTIEVNPAATDLSELVDVKIAARAKTTFGALGRLLGLD